MTPQELYDLFTEHQLLTIAEWSDVKDNNCLLLGDTTAEIVISDTLYTEEYMSQMQWYIQILQDKIEELEQK